MRTINGAAMRSVGESHMIKGLIDLCGWIKTQIQGPIQMAEVGVYSGESAMIFIENLPIARYFAIDAWRPDLPDVPGVTDDPLFPKAPISEAEEVFDERTKSHNGVIVKMKMLSLDAAKRIADDFLDLVYIDADHHYEAAKADILAFKPKVRPGGILSGHDYTGAWTHTVGRAVDEVFGKNAVKVFQDWSWAIKI